MATIWDQRFAADHYVYGTEPNAYLRSQSWRLPKAGAALSVADGEGRNGVFLAQAGLEVLAVDSSQVGLDKAQDLARSRDVCLRTLTTDLGEWGWRRDAFDVVVSIYAHFPPVLRRQINRHIVDSLRPGGLIILEAFHKDQVPLTSGGPKDPDMLYDLAMIEQDFAGLETLERLSGIVRLDEGPLHQGEARVVRYVGRRP